MNFENKVVIVTGAGGGIGRGIAEAFHRQGAVVWFTDIDGESVKKAASEAGERAFSAVLDVADAEQVKGVMEKIHAESGRIDILINNAGIANAQMVECLPVEEWRRLIDINLTGVFICSQAVIPYMKQQQYGKIVNITSTAAKRMSYNGSAAYTAAKSGVLGFTRHLAFELACYGINVNAICPGATVTPLLESALSPEQMKARRAMLPIGRLLYPQDQAEAVMFLCSDEARAVCGVALEVDGGSLLGWINRDQYQIMREGVMKSSPAPGDPQKNS